MRIDQLHSAREAGRGQSCPHWTLALRECPTGLAWEVLDSVFDGSKEGTGWRVEERLLLLGRGREGSRQWS